MSPVKIDNATEEKLTFWRMLLNADRAKSAGESQTKSPKREAGSEGFREVVFRWELAESKRQHSPVVQLASPPTS